MLGSQVAAEALAAASSEMARLSNRPKRRRQSAIKKRDNTLRKLTLYTIDERMLQYQEALHIFRTLKDEESWYGAGQAYRQLLKAEADMLAHPKTSRIGSLPELPPPLNMYELKKLLHTHDIGKSKSSPQNANSRGVHAKRRQVVKHRGKKRAQKRKEKNKKLIALSELYTHKQPHVELDQVSKLFRERRREESEASEVKRVERNGYGGVKLVAGGYDYESQKAKLRIKALRQDVVTIAVPDPLYDSHYAKIFRPLLPVTPLKPPPRPEKMRPIEDELRAAMSAHSIAANKLKVKPGRRRDLRQLMNPKLKSYR